MTKWKVGEPCNHTGCLSHLSHPCEGCGRIAGGRMSGNKKVAVYTAIFDGYDKIRNPLYATMDGSVDYWMLTEPSNDWKSDVWRGYPLEAMDQDNLTPRMRSRFWKMRPHLLFPKADITIWHGGNIQLKVDPWFAIEEWLGDADMALFRHPHRDCVYEEAEVAVAMGKEQEALARSYCHYLNGLGYPRHHGLAACWFMIRRNNKTMKAFHERWWNWMRYAGLRRDQLCFNPVLWRYRKHGPQPKINWIPGNLLTSPHFKYNQHVK